MCAKLSLQDIRDARARISELILETPLITCQSLNKICGGNIFLKAENLQISGSFKIRGASNAILRLVEKEKNKNQTLVTWSSGNFGIACAMVAKTIKLPCYVVMSDRSRQKKVDAIRNLGASVIFHREGKKDEVLHETITTHNATFISTAQNNDVMAGQGSVALEILEKYPNIDTIVIPVGGGGLIAGVAIAAKSIKPDIKIVGAESELSCSCYQSKQQDKLCQIPFDQDCLADGICYGSIGPATWPVIREYVDDVITVSEKEILEAIKIIFNQGKLVIEPTAAVGVAAILSKKFSISKHKNVAVILTGGNADIKDTIQLLS